MSDLDKLLSEMMLKEALKDLSVDDEHLINGGSQISKRMGCSGSLEMEHRFPQDSAGFDAELGTTIHELIENYIPLYHDDDDWKDRIPSGVKDEHKEAAISAVEDIDNRVYGPDSFYGQEKIVIVETWRVEEKYIANPKSFRGGKADYSALLKYKIGNKIFHRGIIWDYKNGRYPVDAKTSPQLVEYAIGMYKEYKDDCDFDGFDLYIYQPNNSSTHRTHRFISMEELLELDEKAEFAARKNMGLEGERTLTAGSHCMFCSGKVGCPAFDNMMKEEASLDFSVEPEELEGLEIKSLSDQRVLSAYKLLPLISRYKKDLENHILSRAMLGDPVEGTEAIYKRKNRAWIDDQDIIISNIDQVTRGTIPLSAIFDRKIKSQSQVKAALKLNGTSKEDIKEFMEKSTTKPGKRAVPVLVEEVKDRQVARAIVDEFEPIDEEE